MTCATALASFSFHGFSFVINKFFEWRITIITTATAGTIWTFFLVSQFFSLLFDWDLTLPNWVREFEKWLPSLPVVRYHGPRATRDAMLATTFNFRRRRTLDFPVKITSSSSHYHENNNYYINYPENWKQQQQQQYFLNLQQDHERSFRKVRKDIPVLLFWNAEAVQNLKAMNLKMTKR